MRLFLIISGLLLSALCLWLLGTKGASLTSLGGLAFFGGASLLFIFEKQWASWISQQGEKKNESTNCVIQADGFFFPKGYYFKQGYLKNQQLLPFTQIQEIRINTFPRSLVTRKKEVIFLKGLERDQLEKLAYEKGIKVTEPLDIWSLICDEFLDTEFSEEAQQKTRERLSEIGISEEELMQIRKKLRTSMLLRTSVSWEWVYYGQFDVLQELWPLTEKKYWWTMEIALRNA